MRINGKEFEVSPGTSVAAALLNIGYSGFRRSETGESRGPVCGMGICLECRVQIGGVRHVRACMVTCQDHMEIETDA
ncbi:MAG: (2Fe-2S)-binding protein [Fimbriimonas sp.]|nr:(2Fe-2S)-binding protein [Fimbriimonas sp.]